MYSLATLFTNRMHGNKVLSIAAVLLITTMLVSVRFTIKLNVSATHGSMTTLQKRLASYAASIVRVAAQRDNTYHYFPPAIAVADSSLTAPLKMWHLE